MTSQVNRFAETCSTSSLTIANPYIPITVSGLHTRNKVLLFSTFDMHQSGRCRLIVYTVRFGSSVAFLSSLEFIASVFTFHPAGVTVESIWKK